MSWLNRLRNPPEVPVNYIELSDEEDLESGLVFDSPLTSPQRPHQSPSVSPRALLQPDPPLVEEVVEQVTKRLSVLPDDEDDLKEEVDEGLVVGEAPEKSLNMPDDAAAAVVDFEDENGQDEARVLQDACKNAEKVQWEENDLQFYFQQVEIKMAAVGVKKNFTKFQVLADILPHKVISQVKPLLRKKETDFAPANDAYKRLKNEVIRIFGPKPEDAVYRALGRVMTGKPSELARELVNDLCSHDLACDCCPAIVTAIWKRHLPGVVRAGLAKYRLTNDNFDEVLQLADDIYYANRPATAGSVSAASLDETQPAIPYATQEVAATNRGRGRGGRGGRGRGGRGGGGRGAANTTAAQPTQSRYRGPKHPDLPPGPWDGCQMHHRFGKSAHFCTEPLTCKWKDILAPKPAKNQ